MRSTKIIKKAVLVYGHVYIIIMVILRSQNKITDKITDFFMILAWVWAFINAEQEVQTKLNNLHNVEFNDRVM